jgi:predicted transposase YdaD
LNTDRWFYGVFQSAPDLIRWLAASPDGTPPSGAVPMELDRQYRFSAPELKAGSHRLDGLLWPLGSETGSEELPVVFLEVQMRADPGFHHRLAAQTFRFLQLHPRIEHWQVVVITPHRRLSLGPVTPLRGFLEPVHWVSLDGSAHPAGAPRAGAGAALPADPGEPAGSGAGCFLYAV